MKRLITLSLVFVLILSLCACASSKNDEAFLKNLEKGLDKRWEKADNYTLTTESAYRKHLDELVQLELDAIGDLSEYTFEDSALAEYAEAYYDALLAQQDGAQYYGLDNNRYTELFTKEGYYGRCAALYQLSQDYDLFSGSKHEETYEEMLVLGEVYLQGKEKIEGLSAILSETLRMEALGGTDYEVLFTNTTDYDFSGLSLNFNLYDEDYVLVGSTTSYIDNCAAGSTVKPNVWISEDFDSCEAQFEYYDDTLTQYMESDWVAVDYTNDMVITIELGCELPVQIDEYNYNDSLKSTCTVTAFEYEEAYWQDGKATLSMYIDGTKTYDSEDDNTSRSISISWKLYDEDGTVVDSGSFRTDSLATGESFVDTHSYASDLKPGNYRLEFLNTSNEALTVSVTP